MRILVVDAGVSGLACADVSADERCSARFGEAFTHPVIVSARVFTGNRPTTSIMAPALTPSVLGQLIALYEHITFVEGAVWGIDSFDQWGVELGKVLAKQILPAIEGSSEALDAQDQSTRALIEYYRAHRTK